jgi:hypothetical protein
VKLAHLDDCAAPGHSVEATTHMCLGDSAAELHEGLNTVKLFMDESGNGNTDLPLIVGAVELYDNADDVEENTRSLYKRLSAMSSLEGLPSFEEFRKHGFHSKNDPPEIKAPFLELIRTTSFRAYMVVTDRTGVPGNTESEQIEFMYVKLLSDLLIRHRKKSELFVNIEQSADMRSIIQRLPSSANKQAQKTRGKAEPLPKLNIEMVTKTDHMSMAIVDYVMAAAARWLRENRTTDPKIWQYRAFRELEQYVSVLYSFEHGLISNRKVPLK